MTGRKGLINVLRRLRSFFLPRKLDLRLELRRIERVYRPVLSAAQGEERERELSEYFYVRDLVAEELEELRTQQLLRKAHRFDVVVPKRPYGSDRHEDDNWERGSTTDRWFLKAAGRQLVRKYIREEKESRFKELTRWVSLLIPIIFGLLGAVTGLVAALKK